MRLVIFRERLQLQYLISTSILHHIIFIIFLIYNTNFIYLHNLERLAWLGKIWVTVAWVLLSLWLGTAEGGVIWASSPCPKKSNEIAWVKSSGDWCINRTNSSSVLLHFQVLATPSLEINHTHMDPSPSPKACEENLAPACSMCNMMKGLGLVIGTTNKFPRYAKASKGFKGMKGDLARVYDGIRLEVFFSFSCFRRFQVPTWDIARSHPGITTCFPRVLNSDELGSVLWT